MATPSEHYTVLQVLFVPQDVAEQPTKLVRLKPGEAVQTALKGFKPGSVYAWRTFEKEVCPMGGLLGLLLASEEASGHTPWTFLQGQVLSLDSAALKGVVTRLTAEFYARKGKTKVVRVKDDLLVFISDEDDVSAL